MNYEKQQFLTAERKENIAFEQIRNKIFNYIRKKDGDDVEIVYNYVKEWYTDKKNLTGLDILIQVYKDGSKLRSFIVESKVRETHYSNLMLEKFKYKKLLRLKKKELEYFPSVTLLYTVFTPKGTYLFNLDNPDCRQFIKNNESELYCPKKTVVDYGKEYKKVVNLPILSNFCTDLKFRLDYTFESYCTKKLDEELNRQNRQECIFKSLRYMEERNDKKE